MMEGRGLRPATGLAMNIVTKNAGLNRFVWNVQNAAGVGAPPGAYKARLTVAGNTQAVPFAVLIDPRLAAEGTTIADLSEQFAHNTRVRTLVTDVNALASMVERASREA